MHWRTPLHNTCCRGRHAHIPDSLSWRCQAQRTWVNMALDDVGICTVYAARQQAALYTGVLSTPGVQVSSKNSACVRSVSWGS